MRYVCSKLRGSLCRGSGFKFTLLLTLIVLSLSLIAGAAYAATYYIAATGGSDSNTGTSISQPWATWSHAQSKMNSGDTLYFMNGTWSNSSSNVIDITKSDINLEALNQWQAIIDCGGAGTSAPNGFEVESGVSNVTIKNFQIQNCQFGADTGGGASYITFFGNKVHDSYTGLASERNSSATWNGSSCTGCTDHITMDSNIIYNFGLSGNNQYHGVYAKGTNSLVQNNLIYGNLSGSTSGGYPIQFRANDLDSIWPFGTGIIANNTINAANSNGTTCITPDNLGNTPPEGTLYVYNNICFNASAFWAAEASSTYNFDYNILDTGSTICANGSCPTLHNQLVTNPNFTNATGNIYTLAPNSPAINAGTSTYLPSYDITGSARTNPGIGAYAYAGTSATQYAITASAGSGGGISPSGSVQVSQGGNQSFTITPNAGYHIANVTVDGASLGAVATYTFSSVSANHTIAATFTANTTYTITATAGAGGSISPSGSTIMNQGVSQSYTITPNSGYKIASVTVDGAAVGAVATYTFSNVSANHTIAATFSANTYTITASAGTNGSISPSGTTTVNGGGSQTYTITPATGYLIASVTVDGTSAGTVSSYTFSNVTANHTIAATFVIDPYTITATAGTGGSISPSGSVSVNYGASQSFTITPAANYKIASVTVDGASVGAVATYTFSNVTTNHTIAATFTANSTYTITATAGAGGSISPSGATTVNSGGSQTYTISPSSGYSISSVLVDGTSAGAVSSYTFSSVKANHTISAVFAVNTSSNVAFAANAGGGQYTSQSGVVYKADTDYSGGTSASTSSAITGTSDPALYQTERYGNFSYNIPLADGNYNVTLKFAEIYWNAAGERVFNVTMQGTQVISNLDIYSKVGKNAAYDVTIPVSVTNGTLNINFSTVVDNAKVSAILVTSASAGSTYSITATAGTGGSISPSGATTVNSGGSQTYTITPSSGYSISGVQVDGASVGAVGSYTFSNVTANHTIAATFTATVTPQTSVFAANAGGGQYTSQTSGIVFKADADFSGGTTASTTAAITGTSDPTVYQTERYGNFSYNIPLADGNYNVTLKFAEIYWNAAGARVFNVSMQGTQVISNLDIYSKVGKDAAYDVTIPVSVTNGQLTINFSSVVDYAKVSAIVVTGSQSSTSTSFATDSGGGQYTSQTSGIVYQADADFSGGTTASTTAAITGTSDPTVYQTERYGNFSYNIPLADGNYNVTLKFAEIYWNAAGARVFNVSMQGTQVISNLDIYSKVGKNAAYDVTIPVSVTNGTLNINFSTVVDNAKVSAILVTPN